ncbi:hypothetical protein [Robertkochia aurantiaca]|uniref:hypothetical protein n=1 Tax=Robertkochia aurantiaca TaxID=2873700 RepID=UPI001CCAAC7C|nr:hypothetical protein [Robertkochia sp. 3YJGBD-33]
MKILKKIGVVLLLVLFAMIIGFVIYNEPLPEGTESDQAEVLAQRMLRTLNHTNYEKTGTLTWSFPGGHHYRWDKTRQQAEVAWDDNRVILNLNNYDKSEVYQNEVRIYTEPREELIETAVSYFNNDSFWVVAPFKIYDKGVVRKYVTLDDPELEGLLVTYTTGGNTPGDSYLWMIDQNGFPVAYKMWVQIIPLGGLKASWDDWKLMESGIYLPQSHKIGPFSLKIDNLKAFPEEKNRS